MSNSPFFVHPLTAAFVMLISHPRGDDLKDQKPGIDRHSRLIEIYIRSNSSKSDGIDLGLLR